MNHKALVNMLPLGAIALVLASTGWQHWQKTQAARPGYDVPNAVSMIGLAPEPSQSERATVVSVTDGDTIVIRQGGREDRVRFCGIDAPEMSQPLGPESKAHLQRLIDEAGGQVVIVPVERDRYGRQIAEVFTVLGEQEKSLQQELLMAGMVYVYPQYVDGCPNGQPMRMAEAIAQQNRVGVWSSNYQRPWDYRRSR